MTNRPTRYMVIGAGSRGNAYARAVTNTTPGTIHAVAEPHDIKRRRFGEAYIWGPTPHPGQARYPGQDFRTWQDWLIYEDQRRKRNEPPSVDAVFICTLDETHVEIIKAIAHLNLHILCEKPLALSLDDCLTVYSTLNGDAPRSIFSIGHVLRYSPHNRLLRKLLLEDGVIGDVVSLEHTEPVGWWHFSHSYVRGNWRRATKNGDGSLLTKSCHDIDFILWLLCSPVDLEGAEKAGHGSHFPRSVSSFGSLTQFRSKRKPKAAGDATNCTDCPVENECSYSAVKIYKERHLDQGVRGWPVDIVCPDIEDVFAREGEKGAERVLMERLGEDYGLSKRPMRISGPMYSRSPSPSMPSSGMSDEEIAKRPWYGRCVYEADNNVVDHQVVTFSWEDEETIPHRLAKTATFHMIAPTEKQCERRGRVYGTKGEIEYDSTNISIYDFASAETKVINVPKPPPERAESHGGGDYGLAGQFVAAVEAVVHGELDVQTAQARFVGCTLKEAVQSHAAVFAAEEARREEKVVQWGPWWAEKLASAGLLDTRHSITGKSMALR